MARRSGRIGPNDPCSCGSGIKSKKCCGSERRGGPPAEGGRSAALHGLDRALVVQLIRSACETSGHEWLEAAMDEYGLQDPETELSLFEAWALHAFQDEDDAPTVAEQCLAEPESRLSPQQRGWLEAVQAAWTTIWEVADVAPGSTLTLRDALTGTTRTVFERSASRTLRPGHMMLGRIVDYDGLSLMVGMDARPLGPVRGLEVLDEVREALGLGESDHADPEDLRDPETWCLLADIWRDQFEGRGVDHFVDRLHNTDGDPLELVTERFAFDPADRLALLARLRDLPGSEVEEAEPGLWRVTFSKPGSQTSGMETVSEGSAELGPSELVLDTNSMKRADSLRERIEAAATGLLRRAGRETKDKAALRDDLRKHQEMRELFPDRDEPGAEDEIPPEVAGPIIRQYKEKHYSTWPDIPLPALAGLTPRQAAADPRQRRRLEALLRELELGEEAHPTESRYDVGKLRQTLGMPGSEPR